VGLKLRPHRAEEGGRKGAGLPAQPGPRGGLGIGGRVDPRAFVIPVKQPPGGRELDIDTRTRNAIQRSLRCLGERGSPCSPAAGAPGQGAYLDGIDGPRAPSLRKEGVAEMLDNLTGYLAAQARR
jgi:hypothetical protein